MSIFSIPVSYPGTQLPDEPAFVRFIDGSLMAFNTLTGSDTELVKNYDKNGRLRNYRLEKETLLVFRKVSSREIE